MTNSMKLCVISLKQGLFTIINYPIQSMEPILIEYFAELKATTITYWIAKKGVFGLGQKFSSMKKYPKISNICG